MVQQRDCDRWLIDFNNVRPHEALGKPLMGVIKLYVAPRPGQPAPDPFRRSTPAG